MVFIPPPDPVALRDILPPSSGTGGRADQNGFVAPAQIGRDQKRLGPATAPAGCSPPAATTVPLRDVSKPAWGSAWLAPVWVAGLGPDGLLPDAPPARRRPRRAPAARRAWTSARRSAPARADGTPRPRQPQRRSRACRRHGRAHPTDAPSATPRSEAARAAVPTVSRPRSSSFCPAASRWRAARFQRFHLRLVVRRTDMVHRLGAATVRVHDLHRSRPGRCLHGPHIGHESRAYGRLQVRTGHRPRPRCG